MVGLAVLCFVLAALAGVSAAKPRAVWWALNSWRYRDPEANEPSDTLLALEALAAGAFAIALVGGGIWALVAESPEEAEARREADRDSCEQIMSELDSAFGESEDLGRLRRRAGELGVDIEVEEIALPPGAPASANRVIVTVTQDGETLGALSESMTRDSC